MNKPKQRKRTARGSLQAVVRSMTFDIDPCQGAAALFGGCALEGHEFVSLERKGKKVTCHYRKKCS